MDAKSIIYGETALEKLVQWLRATNEPQTAEKLVKYYLELLQKMVAEEYA